MNWYSKNAADIAFIALLSLGFLGVAVSFVHNLTNRFGIRVLFAFLFVTFAAVAWHANKTDREAFEARLTGGDHFAFVRVREETDRSGKNNMVAITTTGTLPSLHIGFYPVLPDGTVLKKKQRWVPQFRDLPPSTFHPAIALEPGRYQIHFLMGEKKWIEHLEFERSAKGVTQVLWVERNGRVIYREPPEDGTR